MAGAFHPSSFSPCISSQLYQAGLTSLQNLKLVRIVRVLCLNLKERCQSVTRALNTSKQVLIKTYLELSNGLRKAPRPFHRSKLQNEKNTCCQETQGYHRGKAWDESYADAQTETC